MSDLASACPQAEQRGLVMHGHLHRIDQGRVWCSKGRDPALPHAEADVVRQPEGRCARCRREFCFRDFVVDHKVAKAKGGTDHLEKIPTALLVLEPDKRRAEPSGATGPAPRTWNVRRIAQTKKHPSMQTKSTVPFQASRLDTTECHKETTLNIPHHVSEDSQRYGLPSYRPAINWSTGAYGTRSNITGQLGRVEWTRLAGGSSRLRPRPYLQGVVR